MANPPTNNRARTPSISISSSDSYSSSDDSGEFAFSRHQQQREWEEGLEQLSLLFSVVLVPVLGKWLGRRWSGWLYARYLRVGLGSTFFFGGRFASVLH